MTPSDSASTTNSGPRMTGRVVISGVGGDIGRAIAHEFSQLGVDVHGFDAVLRSIPLDSPGAEIQVERIDTTDALAVEAFVHALPVIRFGVINAGIVRPASFLETSVEDWRQQLEVNLTGAFLLGQALAKKMIAQGDGGSIVLLGSWVGVRPANQITAYSVSKAGLTMLMKCMAKELAAHGIRVNEVAPGYVDAGLSGKIFAENPELRAKCLAEVPLSKLISPGEIARQVSWLCRPECDHITGSTILMDGGLSL